MSIIFKDTLLNTYFDDEYVYIYENVEHGYFYISNIFFTDEDLKHRLTGLYDFIVEEGYVKDIKRRNEQRKSGMSKKLKLCAKSL